MTSRTRLLVPAALGIALLSGCGTTHPGAAAVVDGTRIRIADVDSAAAALCSAGGAQQVEDSSAARQEVLRAFVRLEIARDVAAEADVDVPESAWRTTDDQVDQLRELLGDRTEDVLPYVEALRRDEAISAALGADGAERISAAADAADIDVDPRFEDRQVSPAPATDVPAVVPETQFCG